LKNKPAYPLPAGKFNPAVRKNTNIPPRPNRTRAWLNQQERFYGILAGNPIPELEL
jgi:hypothetical protein